MKEEIKRVMKLVQEGKLSPEDAAELIEAFGEAPEEVEQEQPAGVGAAGGPSDSAKSEDPIGKLIGSIEKIGKDVAKNVNWNDIANQVRQGIGKGVDAVKHAAEEARKNGGFAVIFGNAQTKHVELPLQVPEGKTLRIELKAGDVTIEGGIDIGSISVDATFRAYDETEAKNAADAYTPVLEESEHFVVFRQPENLNASTDIVARVPAGVPVEIKLASGDVVVTDTKASVRIEGASGDVKLTNVGGAVRVSQRSGDVSVSQAECSMLTLDTKSGDISVDRGSGVVEIKTSSGDVCVLDSRPKSLSVEAASGDIRADLAAPPEGSVNITSVTGDVKVSIVDGADCRVSLSTLRGSVASTIELADQIKDEHKITGRLGEGQHAFDVSVVTGNVSLGLRDSTQT